MAGAKDCACTPARGGILTTQIRETEAWHLVRTAVHNTPMPILPFRGDTGAQFLSTQRSSARSAATRKRDRRSPHVLHGAWRSFNGESPRQEGTSARPPAPAATTLDRPEPTFLSNGVTREALVVTRASSVSSPNAVLIAYLLLHLHLQSLGDPRARKGRVKHAYLGRSAHALLAQ